jgi:hypothetical protein
VRLKDRSLTSELVAESFLEKVDLSDLQRELLRAQWWGRLVWMDRRAKKNWVTYTILRLISVVGAVLVPALVATSPPAGWEQSARITTFSLSLCVAIATALESFLRSGERWRHYRRNAEALRLEGMQYFMLSGPYTNAVTHNDAFHDFATRLNAILSTEVDAYFTQVAAEKQRTENSHGSPAETPE